MNLRLGAALALIALLGAATSHAQAAPLMTVLIKPGAMSEAVGKGDFDVTMTIPGVDVAAGAPFLSMECLCLASRDRRC